MNCKIGIFSQRVIDLLGLKEAAGTAIYIGPSNIKHMQQRHPADYAKYQSQIGLILLQPDYVGLHPSNGSIEFVKEFKIDNEFVKVAVRVSGKGTYFVRSMYVLQEKRVKNFIQKGNLHKV